MFLALHGAIICLEELHG